MSININFAKKLIKKHCPHFSNMQIDQILPGGYDNYMFRLGDKYVLRLPSGKGHIGQIEKEYKYLPYLSKHLSIKIPKPIFLGEKDEIFAEQWGIYEWIEGDIAMNCLDTLDLNVFASDLADFILELHSIESKNAPSPEVCQRGGDISIYEDYFRQAITVLREQINVKRAEEIWETALATKWEKEKRWVHGDISAANLLVEKGRLSAVIDFGCMCAGDPACDLVIAWTFFEQSSRDVFLSKLNMDEDTIKRAKAWALLKALLILANLHDSNDFEIQAAPKVIRELLS